MVKGDVIKGKMTNELSIILYFQPVRDSNILLSSLNFIERFQRTAFINKVKIIWPSKWGICSRSVKEFTIWTIGLKSDNSDCSKRIKGSNQKVSWKRIRGKNGNILWFVVVSSHKVVSDSLPPHELQHARLPYPSLSPWVCSNSSPWSRWCHPTVLCSSAPFSFLLSFPASGSFPVNQLFPSGVQNIGVSASASVLLRNTQDWSPLGWTDWVSLQSKGLSSLQHLSSKIAVSSVLSLLYGPTFTSIHVYWKNHSFDYTGLCR